MQLKAAKRDGKQICFPIILTELILINSQSSRFDKKY